MARVAGLRFASSLFAMALVACAALPAQRARRAGAPEQTEFGSETRIERPVRPPPEAVELLFAAEAERLDACLRATGGTRAGEARELSASEIDINGDARRDLIVQAVGGCFIGAHNTGWWLFSKTGERFGARVAPGFFLVFGGRGDRLRVLRLRTYGYRDIETMDFAGAGTQFYYTVWKFDGQTYKARVCSVEENGRRTRVPCDR